jgi:hypothetical protein
MEVPRHGKSRAAVSYGCQYDPRCPSTGEWVVIWWTGEGEGEHRFIRCPCTAHLGAQVEDAMLRLDARKVNVRRRTGS